MEDYDLTGTFGFTLKASLTQDERDHEAEP